jgi:hypothetical protein
VLGEDLRVIVRNVVVLVERFQRDERLVLHKSPSRTSQWSIEPNYAPKPQPTPVLIPVSNDGATWL